MNDNIMAKLQKISDFAKTVLPPNEAFVITIIEHLPTGQLAAHTIHNINSEAMPVVRDVIHRNLEPAPNVKIQGRA